MLVFFCTNFWTARRGQRHRGRGVCVARGLVSVWRPVGTTPRWLWGRAAHLAGGPCAPRPTHPATPRPCCACCLVHVVVVGGRAHVLAVHCVVASAVREHPPDLGGGRVSCGGERERAGRSMGERRRACQVRTSKGKQEVAWPRPCCAVCKDTRTMWVEQVKEGRKER